MPNVSSPSTLWQRLFPRARCKDASCRCASGGVTPEDAVCFVAGLRRVVGCTAVILLTDSQW